MCSVVNFWSESIQKPGIEEIILRMKRFGQRCVVRIELIIQETSEVHGILTTERRQKTDIRSKNPEKRLLDA